MLLYEKKVNGVKHIYGTLGNIPSEEDAPVIYKDDEGTVLTDVAYNQHFVDDKHQGMIRVEDGTPVTVWIGDVMVIPPSIQPGPTPGPEVESIAWTQTPTKTTYTLGEAIQLAGSQITATYSDATTEDVTAKSTFTPAEGTATTAAMNKVTAKYKKKSASTPITVNAPVVLQSIAFTTEPTTKVYTEGDAISLAGAVVTATYSDSTTAVVTNSCTFNPANGTAATVAMNKITATYNGKTAEVAITVNPKPPVDYHLYYGVTNDEPTSVQGLTSVVKTATDLIANGFTVELTTDDQYSVVAVDNELNVQLTKMTQNGFDLVFKSYAAAGQTIYYGEEKSTDTATIVCTFAAK